MRPSRTASRNRPRRFETRGRRIGASTLLLPFNERTAALRVRVSAYHLSSALAVRAKPSRKGAMLTSSIGAGKPSGSVCQVCALRS